MDLANNSACRASALSVNGTCSVISSYLIIASLSINVLLSLPANCYILWLSMKEMIQGQSTDIFVFNTALAEIIFCTSYFLFIPHLLFNCIACELGALFLGLVVVVGRPLFLSCICVERYLGVLHPVTFLKFKPMKYRISICIAGWVLVIGSCILVTEKVIGMYAFILPDFLIFFSIKLFTCLVVLKALLRPGPGEDKGMRRNRVHRDKLRAFWIILTVLVCSLLMYGPSTLTLILYYFIDWKRFMLSWSISSSIGLLTGFVQPFLYLKRLGKLSFC